MPIASCWALFRRGRLAALGTYPGPQGHDDGEVECATLDEALTHLRELILNEMADPDGPIFSRYGLHFERSVAQEEGYVRCGPSPFADPTPN